MWNDALMCRLAVDDLSSLCSAVKRPHLEQSGELQHSDIFLTVKGPCMNRFGNVICFSVDVICDSSKLTGSLANAILHAVHCHTEPRLPPLASRQSRNQIKGRASDIQNINHAPTHVCIFTTCSSYGAPRHLRRHGTSAI